MFGILRVITILHNEIIEGSLHLDHVYKLC
jgi:hypothetical protein